MLIIDNIMHSANFIVYKFLVQLSCVLRKKKNNCSHNEHHMNDLFQHYKAAETG